MTRAVEVGYLLRSSLSDFVAGCRVSRFETEPPDFGRLVRASIGGDDQVYGLIYDIRIDDDGLIRQLVTAEGVDEATIQDNRENRTVPIEISIVAVGYSHAGKMMHLLPPRPPLSLDMIYLCDPQEIRRFSDLGRFGYFRHILRAQELPIPELLASHIQQANQAHQETGDHDWANRATRELITLLRDDYATLMNVLSALGDVVGSYE